MIKGIYFFLQKWRRIWLLLVLVIWAFLGFQASKIAIQEDVSKALPQSGDFQQYQDFFKKSALASKMVVAIGVDDSLDATIPITPIAESYFARVDSLDTSLVKNIQFRIETDNAAQELDFFYQNIALFLDTSEQNEIAAQMDSSGIQKTVDRTISKLMSPEGFALKDYLLKDPMGMQGRVLQKVMSLNEAGDFLLKDKHLFTEDGKFLLLIISPAFAPSESKNNGELIGKLQQVKQEVLLDYPHAKIYLYGGPVVAAANAAQIKTDAKLAGGLAVLLILALLFWYYRKWFIPFLFLLPPFFGLTLGVAALYWFTGEVSVLSLAAGSIVLGIALDYCFHLFTHLNHSRSVVSALVDISGSLILSCFTTVLAFMSLLFVDSQVLSDFGILASMTLIGTLFFVLLVMPHLFAPSSGSSTSNNRDGVLQMFFLFLKRRQSVVLGLIVTISVFLSFFVGKASFEDDLNKINYMSAELLQAEAVITNSDERERVIFAVSKGNSFQDALDNNVRLTQVLDSIQMEGLSNSVISLNHIFPSSKEAALRASNWNKVYVDEASVSRIFQFKTASKNVGLKENAFASFYDLLQSEQSASIVYADEFLSQPLFQNFLLYDPNGAVEIINLLNVKASAVEDVLAGLNKTNALVVDKSQMAESLVTTVSDNFNFILLITTGLVFFTLLLTYGRIELALMTFFPMALSWVWILGICGLFDIKFNFVNVLITTFIFGLGDDFCIFVTDGLLSKYRIGKDKLSSYRSSILLSTATTVIGTGILIFSKHPALHSIALLSVIGMFCISFISLTLQPILFNFAVQQRVDKKLAPLTLATTFFSIIAFGYFALGSVFLSLVVFVLMLFPLPRKVKRPLLSYVISKTAGSVIYLMTNVRKEVRNPHNETFDKPAIIVSNHQSFIDILAVLMLNKRIVILSKKWVWNSPLFGVIVRYAGFPTSINSIEDNFDSIEQSLKEGYSIAVFPEGTRSTNGEMKRFHKGAFLLAEKYKLDIVPVLLHGFSDTIKKGDYTLQSGRLTISILKRIRLDDAKYGTTYTERTKGISRYMKAQFAALKEELETVDYYRNTVLSNYIYKGPILEWYVRIKLRLERNFKVFDTHVPKSGRVYDMGCGNGYLSLMLSYTGPHREIIATDFDESKVELAKHCYGASSQLSFTHQDLMSLVPVKADCYIFKDVLHYLPHSRQQALLSLCAKELSSGGKLIVRDGFEDEGKHATTKLTELLSIKLLGFNKADHPLSFLKKSMLQEIAEQFGLIFRQIDENKSSSNQTFVLEKE